MDVLGGFGRAYLVVGVDSGGEARYVASLDILRLRRLVSTEQYNRGSQLLEAIVSMPTKID